FSCYKSCRQSVFECDRLAMCRRFFFQAEDGIRDGHVTGVQTCALPILCRPNAAAKSSSVPNPHLYNCTIASRVHPSSPDCQRIYGWPFTSTWVSPLPSTTWTDLAGSHPGKRSEEHTSELQSRGHLVCRLLLEKKKTTVSV